MEKFPWKTLFTKLARNMVLMVKITMHSSIPNGRKVWPKVLKLVLDVEEIVMCCGRYWLVGGGVYYVCWPSWYSAQNYPHLSGWVGRKNISSPWPWWWSVEKFWLQSDWFLWIIQICKWRKPIYLNVHNLGLSKSLEAEGKWTFQEKDKSLVLIEVL